MASIKDLKSKLSTQPSEEKDDQTFEMVDNKAEFTAETIDDALENACQHFNTSRMNLDYEIIQKASKGVLGIGKKPFKLLVWVTGDISGRKVRDMSLYGTMDESFGILEAQKSTVGDTSPVNGQAKVIIRKTGVYLKVLPPRNNGQPATLEDVQLALASRNIKTYKQADIKNITKDSKGEEIKIADWHPSPDYDSKVSLEVSPDQMKAYVTVTAPILSGRILEENEINDLLEANGIVFGIMKDKIKSIFEKELFNVPVLIAEGKPPQQGDNAKIEYKFHIDQKDFTFEEDETGKIDYKNRDIVQNVVAGQVLAVKTSATLGIPGRTITNNRIDAQNGDDITFEAGKNTVLSENGLEVIAQIAGRAVLLAGVVSVDPIYEIKGDVDLNTGNIIFLGTVVVKGSILDGFTVKAAGNIEVKGTIGKAEVESDNEIIVGQGILGKEGGKIKAGTNVYAKFIENGNVIAGNDIIIKEEILHSKVDAGGRIICHGKKGTITGGRVRAGFEISAKYLGSQAYTDTFLEAGVDPKYKEKLNKLEEERELSEDQLSKITANISTLQKMKDSGTITEEKRVMLDRMIRAKKEFELQFSEILEDIAELKNYLDSLDTKGKISAKMNVFPGVDLNIKNANFVVKNDFKGVTFVSENNFIKPVPYQPFEGEEETGSRR
ncbi:MAG: FapA family protein [Spirochaetota bacterium]|nr:FapA family protein [Spirochaetota bacterium]